MFLNIKTDYRTMSVVALAITSISTASTAFADVKLLCPEMSMSTFHAEIDTVLGSIPVEQADNLKGTSDKASINVTFANDCGAEIDGVAVGTTDFLRISAEHKENPPAGQPGDGLMIAIAAYVTNGAIAEHAPNAFDQSAFQVDFEGHGPRVLNATFPGGGELKVEFVKFVPDGGIPLGARDFYVLKSGVRSAESDMSCSWDTVGRMVAPPDPANKPKYTGQSTMLASAEAVLALKLEDIECVYRAASN